MLALSLALSLISLGSYILLRTASATKEPVLTESPSIRGFKGEETGPVVIELTLGLRSRWVTFDIVSIDVPHGVGVRQKDLGRNMFELYFLPNFSGNFEGLSLKTTAGDSLGLFARSMTIEYRDFRVEALPRSLLLPVPRARPFLLALGERTAGTRGSGQEFYSVEDYVAFSETKDILWKRVAKTPDEKLLIKIREANIPKQVTIALIEIAERGEGERLAWMDLACEGAALLGKNLLAARCHVRIIYFLADLGLEESLAVSEKELADAAMEMSKSARSPAALYTRLINESDILITGLLEAQDRDFAQQTSRKPKLLISEAHSAPAILGQQSLIFSGIEDVGRLVARVVER